MKRKKRTASEADGKSKKSIKVDGAMDKKQTSEETSKIVCQVQSLLGTQQTRLSGLTKLRDALQKSPNSELVCSFLKPGAECQDIFKILEGGRHNLSQLEIQICLEVLESILLFTASENQPSTKSGMPVVQKILQNHMKLLYSCLNPGGPPEVTRATLRLLTAMVAQGTSAARDVQRTFDFTLKSLQFLANRCDKKAVQDIRTCFINFCLSFLVFGDATVQKQALELKGFLQSIMRGLNNDVPVVVCAVLSTLKGKVVENIGITKKTKVQFFNAYVLSQVAALYQYTRDSEEDRQDIENSSDQTVRCQAHELLLKICTTFKYGICFFNKTGAFSARSNNPVLLRFLRNIASAASSDVLLQELVVKALLCCQDLVKPFLSSLTATYEPRLSMPWIANMNLLKKIYTMLPQPSQMVKKAGVEMTANTIPFLMDVVVPVGVSRTVFSHGIQHASSLVKHATLSLLIVVLERAQDAAACVTCAGGPKMGHTQHLVVGSQDPLLQNFREEVFKVLPDVKTVIALRQNIVGAKTVESPQEEDTINSTILLAQSLKVIHGLQKLWPPVLSHASFDLSKLLPGQHDMSDRFSPPVVQHLTLQILLYAPAGSLKWYQQKGKSGTSFVYRVLDLCGSVKDENICKGAKLLLSKLLHETGLLDNETMEVDIWLGHLHSCLQCSEDRQTLQSFLGEVFTAVAVEPYVYTDIIVELQSEAMMMEANAGQFDETSVHCNGSTRKSLPASPLVVRALIQYAQMVSSAVESGSEAAVRSLSCLARYMNLVVCDMLHSFVNPTILCFAMSRYYGNIVVPVAWAGIRSTHMALLNHVKYWIGDDGEIGDLQVHANNGNKNLRALRSFFNLSVVNSDQATRSALEEFYRLLEPLDEHDLRTSIGDCLNFCKQHLAGDLSPLVNTLRVKCFKITGSLPSETLAPLLQSLPFSVLLWQLLGPAAEEDTANLCQNSWMQGLVMAALEKQPLSRTIPLCFHILLHLRKLTRKLFTTCVEGERSNMQSSILLCFQAIDFLLQRFIEQCPQEQNIKTSLSAAAPTDHEDDGSISGTFHEQYGNSAVHSSSEHKEEGLHNIITVSRAVLQHPVILQCFLWNPGLPESHIISDLSCQLTHSVANLLLAVVTVPSVAPSEKKQLVRPFVDKFCCAANMEIQALQNENGQSSEVLHLFGLFHQFCNRHTVMEFISTLTQLPARLLLNIGSKTKDGKPSVYLHALLLLLDGLFFGVDHLSLQLSINVNSNSKSETEEQIILEAFKRLINVSQDVHCSQLDSAILKLLKQSMVFVLATPTTYLDSCLDHPTESKVTIASTLIVRSAMLRSHFELRCISGSSKEKAGQLNDEIPLREPIMFEDHLLEYCPLACSYLACIKGFNEGSSLAYNSRRQNVISCLFNLYWGTSWKWLSEDTGTISKHSKESCVKLLVALAGSHAVQRDEALSNAFNGLLLMASSWDNLQQRLCQKLLSRLCQNHCPSQEQSYLTSRFTFACMESISHVLIREVSSEQQRYYLEDSLHLLAMVCKSGTPISTGIEGCTTVWKSFVHTILRVKFESIKVHRTLVLLVKALYREVESSDLMSLETLYEMLLSHSGFLDVMLGSKQTGQSDLKEALVELMITVVELKGDCCKPSHLRILFAAYSASLSVTDRSILYLLQLYEKNHTSFRNNRPFLWGPAAVAHLQSTKGLGPSLWQQPSVSEVLELVNVSRMNRSGVLFPRSRRLQPEVQKELCCDEDLYDPCFLLPLFSCLLASNYELDCRKFVERGCLGLTVASLSSRVEHMRQAGYHVLARFMTHLEGARFKERKQIFHLLNCLRSGITTSNSRLPSVVVCFLARAAHILLRPEHSLYVMVNSFLLQRPALDIRDVPLFYIMFNSSSMQHVAERCWMLELLVDGMKDSPDYYLYKRRHVIELTLSYHDSQASDHKTQNMVIHLLLSALKIQPAAYDLVKNYGIVAWIHSLCLKSPAGRSACLTLVHTLWFTLHHGKPGSSDHITKESSDKMRNSEGKSQVSLLSNLAQECALVCWSLLEQLRLNPDVNETSRFFQVLAAIVDYLTANEQPCGLSRDRILSLICLWGETFDETDALNRLLSSVNLSKVVQAGASSTPGFDQLELKTNGLFSLSSILFAWQPLTGSCHETVLIVWRFGLHFLPMSLSANKLTNKFRSSGKPFLGNNRAHCSILGENAFLTSSLGNDVPTSGKKLLTSLPSNHFCSSEESSLAGNRPDTCSHFLLLLLRWLRKCLVRDRALQTFLVASDSVSDIRRFLELFCVYCTGENNVVLEARERINNQTLSVKSWSVIVLELNMVCLVLLTALKRVAHQESEANLPAICRLLSQQPYKEIIAEGLEKVIFPFYPHPGEEMAEMRCHELGDVPQQLVCLFMQEFWFERQLPSHFLSFLLNNKDDPQHVVEKLIEALGGEEVITEWMSG